MDEGLLSIRSAGCGQLVKLLMTLEPHGIFGSNFAYLCILKLSSVYQKLNNNNKQQERKNVALNNFFHKSQEKKR